MGNTNEISGDLETSELEGAGKENEVARGCMFSQLLKPRVRF